MVEHPITPSPELIKEWCRNKIHAEQKTPLHVHIATLAARWGADQELEACCEWLQEQLGEDRWEIPVCLRLARRPKPPSLKERIATAIAHGDTSIALALLDQALPE